MTLSTSLSLVSVHTLCTNTNRCKAYVSHNHHVVINQQNRIRDLDDLSNVTKCRGLAYKSQKKRDRQYSV